MAMYVSAPPLSVMYNRKVGLRAHQQAAVIIYQDSCTLAYELRLPALGCGPYVEWPDFLYHTPSPADHPQGIHPSHNKR